MYFSNSCCFSSSQDELDAILHEVSILFETTSTNPHASSIKVLNDSFDVVNLSNSKRDDNNSNKRSFDMIDNNWNSYPINKKIISDYAYNIITSSTINKKNNDIRLNAFHLILELTNLDSDYHLFYLIHRLCAKDLQLTLISIDTKRIQTFSPNALFTFFYLTHEIYPDCFSHVIEHRLYNQNQCKDNFKVEYIYRFSGTRITNHSLIELFESFINKSQLFVLQSYENLSLSIVHHIVNSDHSLSQQIINNNQITTIICSVMLTINKNSNLISHYDIEILATKDLLD